MNIITQNPFRILGLPGNATERELQKQIGIIKRYAEVGKTESFDYDFEFIGGFKRDTDKIQEASNKIEQAHKKLLYSLFWFIKKTKFDEIAFNNLKENNTQKASVIWNKTLKEEISAKNYSSYLNLSTLYIALSTITSHVNLQKLQTGISLKGNLIHSKSFNNFSKLVTGNRISNDPNEISKKFVDEIIELLKPYLNKRGGIATNNLISFFNSYPSSIQKYIAAKFTEVPISTIEDKIEKTTRERKNNPRNAYKYGVELYKSTKSDITLLKKLMGSSNVQFRLLTDKVANEILQCSIDFFIERQENDSDDNFETNLNKTTSLVKLAYSVAISNQVKQRAKENIETLNRMKDRVIDQAITLLQSIKDAYKTAEAQIKQQVIASLGDVQSINWTKVNELLIRNSIDWDKVVELILKAIPRKNIVKIKDISDSSKISQFKGLVNFVLDKMNYSNKRQVSYLAYWKTVSRRTTSRSTTSTTTRTQSKSTSSSYSDSSFRFMDNSWWILGGLGAFVGLLIEPGWSIVMGAIIGLIISGIIHKPWVLIFPIIGAIIGAFVDEIEGAQIGVAIGGFLGLIALLKYQVIKLIQIVIKL